MRTSIVILLAFYWLSACSSTKSRSEVGQKCAAADDCADGLICISKLCTRPRGSEIHSVVVQAPRDLHYAQKSMTYFVGVPITENQVFYEGDEAQNFEVHPALPDGITLDPRRGTISGIPTGRAPKQTYTVAATNEVGSGIVPIEITVLDIPQNLSLQAKVYYQAITLNWEVLGKPSSYTIYWNMTGNVTKSDQKIENVTTTSWTYLAPRPAVTYYYRVAATGIDGASELSNEVSVPTYGATMVSAGFYHTCAIINDGQVRCWGLGTYGVLGYNNTKRVGTGIDDDTNTPSILAAGNVSVTKDGDGKVVQISAGREFTCALLDNGKVRCWGGGGLLGYGSRNNVGDSPTRSILVAGDVPVTKPGEGKVTQIAAGGTHTCALLEDGQVRCWGIGSNGQLGHGNQENVGNETISILSAGDVPVTKAGESKVIQITAGYNHTCALLRTGEVRCWGGGSEGQLGYNNGKDVGTGIDDSSNTSSILAAGNVPVTQTGDSKVIQISAGTWYTCALLEAGQVRCWGWNNSGALGYRNLDFSFRGHVGLESGKGILQAGNVPVAQTGDGKVIQISSSDDHTCALLQGGKVRCWGFPPLGQLGYGNQNFVPILESGDVPVGGKVVQIAAGGQHTCALLEGGQIRCWGKGDMGELGYSDSKNVGNGVDNDFNVPTILRAGDVPILEPIR